MLKRTYIKLTDGTEVPHEMTMGAALRFKKMTGKELQEADLNDIEELAALVWTGVASASSADGKPLTLGVEELCDRISPVDLKAWAAEMQSPDPDSKKKVEEGTCDNPGDAREEGMPGILDCLGTALGEMGMGYEDFCRLTFPEFEAALRAYRRGEEARSREEWERMRLQTVMLLQPQVRDRLTPERLLPFPWEKPVREERRLTREERRAAAEDALRRLG